MFLGKSPIEPRQVWCATHQIKKAPLEIMLLYSMREYKIYKNKVTLSYNFNIKFHLLCLSLLFSENKILELLFQLGEVTGRSQGDCKAFLQFLTQKANLCVHVQKLWIQQLYLGVNIGTCAPGGTYWIDQPSSAYEEGHWELVGLKWHLPKHTNIHLHGGCILMGQKDQRHI